MSAGPCSLWNLPITRGENTGTYGKKKARWWWRHGLQCCSHKPRISHFNTEQSIPMYPNNQRRGRARKDSPQGFLLYRTVLRDFPGPMVKNPPFQCRRRGPIPSQRTKISHAVEQLWPCATTAEPTCSRASRITTRDAAPCNGRSHVPKLRRDADK